MAKEDFFDKLGDFLNKGAQSLKDRLTLDNTDLLRAVDNNDVAEVERTLRAGVDPNKDDGMERYALPIAIDNNNIAIVQLLLKAKANPNIIGRDGNPPLYKAVYWEHKAITEALLKAGADIYQPNKVGISPFEEAERNHNTAILELMNNYRDQQRAQQKASDKATHAAMKEKARHAREKQIAKEQVQLDREQQRQERAARRARKKAERNLQKRYNLAEGNVLGALIQAIQQKDDQAFRLLLEQVQDINAIDSESQLNPLMAAILIQNGEAVQRLLSRNADVFAHIPLQKHSPLTYAITQNYYKLVDAMLRQADNVVAQLNAADQLLSPQFLAYKDPKMLDLLLSAGADPYFGGQAAPSPVLKAIEKADIPILPVFAKHKVDLNRLIKGRSPLSWAIHFERLDWLIGLLREGANPDIVDTDGNTPLMLAVQAKSEEMVTALVDANADENLMNTDGHTALDLAYKQGLRGKILQLLE